MEGPDLKPLIILDQDEATFKQFIFSRGSSVMEDGSKQMVPKDEG